MQSNNFLPRTTRNRLAMVMAFASLILFITWNLIPCNYLVDDSFGRILWMEWLEEISSTPKAMNFRKVLAKIICILLPLLCVLSAIIIPTWKIWQSSALLRNIAATLMWIGFLILTANLIVHRGGPYFKNILLVTLNFFTTTIALLLFKYESPDDPYAT
jgi:hypothetical protein